MKNIVTGFVIFVVAFSLGVIVGKSLEKSDTKQVAEKTAYEQLGEELKQVKEERRKDSERLKEAIEQVSKLKEEITNLETSKTDYENRLTLDKKHIGELEHELKEAKDALAKAGIKTDESKPGKKNPMFEMIVKSRKVTLEKKYKELLEKMKAKLTLSIDQEKSIEKLMEEHITESIKFIERLFSEGEVDWENMAKEGGKLSEEFDKKLKEILTSSQSQGYEIIQEEKRKEAIANNIKMFMDGIPGAWKGIYDTVELTQEQKEQVQEFLKSSMTKDCKDDEFKFKFETPFDNKETQDKIRKILTPEQQPKFDGYLKQFEEYKKMFEGMFKKEEKK